MPEEIQWIPVPDGLFAKVGLWKLRVSHRLDNGAFAYFVAKEGADNQSRGEEKTIALAKESSIDLMLHLQEQGE